MATLRKFSTGPAPRIAVKAVDGDLIVSGWDRPEVQIRLRGDEDLVVQEGDGLLELSCQGDCVLQAPFQARLQIGSIDGDAAISMMLGGVAVENVDGDLRVASTGAATLGTIDGDLSARSVAGSFVVAAVDGDVRVAQIAGELQLGSVDGDLNLADVVGNIRATIEGDARLVVNLTPGQQVIVAAGGDINCEVPTDANATVQLRAGGDIAVKRLGEVRKGSDTSLAFQLGNGDGTSLQLSADGDLLLRGVEIPKIDMNLSMDADIEDEMERRATELSLKIAQQVETQVADLTQELEEKIGKLDNSDELASKIQDKVQIALRRAEEKLAEAMRKVETRVQEAEQRSPEDSGRSRRKAYAWQAPPPPKPPKVSKATDEERMMILRMIEEGKISVEQAEQLLAAMSK